MNTKDKAYNIMHIISILCAFPFGEAFYRIDNGWFNEWLMLGVVVLAVYFLVFTIIAVCWHKIKIGRAVASVVGQFFNSVIVAIVIYYGVEIFTVRETYTMLGQPTGQTVSGWEAVAADGWAHIVCIPALIVSCLYNSTYWLITHKNRKNNAENNNDKE